VHTQRVLAVVVVLDPFAPEDWAEPVAFCKPLERVGTPSARIAEAVR